MRGKQTLKFQPKKQFAIIVDGQCEFWYFEMMRRNEASINVTLKPKLPQKKKLSEQFKEVKESAMHFDKVFWIVDFDKLIEEDKAKPKGGKSPIQEFREYQEKLNKTDNIKIIINNPCLEFWFLLHFEKTSRFFNTCSSAEKQLKKHLLDYDKSQKYFTKNNDDIYLKLKQNQPNAIENAKALGYFNINNPNSAISEMFTLFKGENNLLN